MADKLFDEIKKRINGYPEGEVFYTSRFADIASLATIRKCLGRLVDAGAIRRVMTGVYEKPKYSELLAEFLPPSPEKVASALAEKYNWTVAPCGDIALNKLGLSTQVPVTLDFASDGPYRDFYVDNIKISFKHKSNREISNMSKMSIMVVQAFKSLGRERVDERIISILRNRLSAEEKEILLKETAGTISWVYENIKEVCSE